MLKPKSCLECEYHDDGDTYHGCMHPAAVGMLLTHDDVGTFPSWCPRGYSEEDKKTGVASISSFFVGNNRKQPYYIVDVV